MQRYNGQLINQFPNIISGNAAAGAQVTIRVKSSGALASLYATDSLSSGTLPNPLTADAKGYYGFYAPDGVYTLDVNIAGTPQLEIQLQDVASLKAQFDNAVLNAGYIPSGTFAAGATLTQVNQVLSDGSSFWRWDGALPKTVTAGSDPTPIGVGGWFLISDGGLRGDLAAVNSTVPIAGVAASEIQYPASSIVDLMGAPKINGKQYSVTSYHAGWAALLEPPQGGGVFVWDEFRSALEHNGITVIDPSKTFPTSWTNESQKQDWYFSQNAGVGCFVRKDTTEITSFMAGCKSDQSSDDTKATQAGVNIAASNRLSYRICRSESGSLGLTLISSKILINSPVRIHGDGYQYCGYVCAGTSAFEIAAGVNNVSLENFFIGQAIRYSVTPNAYVAVKTIGTNASRNFWHNYDRLFIDGFYLPFDVNYLWSTTFTKIVSVFCFGGIYASGVSVNNTVTQCFLGGSKTAGSAGIKIGDGVIPTEGWIIDQSLIAEFAVGVNAYGCSNSHLTNCIIDFFQQYGVFLQSSGTVPSLNWTVSDNYMATDNASGSTGVLMTSNLPAFSSQNRGHTVHNNQILKYDGATLAYGIAQNGNAEGVNIITNNRVSATDFACKIFTGANTIVSNNYWKTGSYSADVAVTLGVNVGG